MDQEKRDLERLTGLCSFCWGVSYNTLRGFGIDYKKKVAQLALKLVTDNTKKVSAFYRLPEAYLKELIKRDGTLCPQQLLVCHLWNELLFIKQKK